MTFIIRYKIAFDKSCSVLYTRLTVLFSVINCSSLMVDPGDSLHISNCGNHYGSKCNFSCAIGYRLNGSSAVTCVAPGNRPPGFWSNPMPVCHGRFMQGHNYVHVTICINKCQNQPVNYNFRHRCWGRSDVLSFFSAAWFLRFTEECR